MKCKKCEHEKEENEFYKGHKVCKKCRIEIVKEWKHNNPERVKASGKKRREERKDEFKKYHADWRENNRERFNEIQRKYRESNRDICRKRCLELYHKEPWKNREWKEKNPEKTKEYSKRYRKKKAEEIKARKNEWNKQNKIHSTPEGKARKAVYMALKRGELLRSPNCEMCNIECKTEAHHRDYHKPLEIIWVCKLCHGGIHVTLRRNKRIISGK